MNKNHDNTDIFLDLFAKYNHHVYVFVRTLVPNRTNADEVFQETCKVLWAKFDQFELGTNFLSWACRVARYEALGFMRKHCREAKLFSDEFYRVIGEQSITTSSQLDLRRSALADCYQQLSENHKELIELSYKREIKIKEIASYLGRSTNAIYKTMKRVHRLLFDCIQKKLASGE